MMGLRIDVRIRWWAHCYPSKCSLSLSLTVALALAHFFRTRFRGASIYLMWAPHRAFIYDSSLDAPNNANHRHREPYTYENTFQYAYQVVFWAFRYQEVANQLARSDIYDFILSKWEREREKCRCLLWWNGMYVKCKWVWIFLFSHSRNIVLFEYKFTGNGNMDTLIIHEIWLLCVTYLHTLAHTLACRYASRCVLFFRQ